MHKNLRTTVAGIVLAAFMATPAALAVPPSNPSHGPFDWVLPLTFNDLNTQVVLGIAICSGASGSDVPLPSGIGGDCRIDCTGSNQVCGIYVNNFDGSPVQFHWCYSFTTPTGKTDCGPVGGPPTFSLTKCLKSCNVSKTSDLLTQYVDVYVSQDVLTGYPAYFGTIYTVDP